ncbi:MAG: VOC family protein [Bacillota bacterium]
MKLDGFGLFVENIEKMVDFYNQVLDFKISYNPGENNVYLKKDNILFLMYGRQNFEEMVDEKFIYPKKYNGTFEIALSVANFSEVDKVFKEVIEKGAKVVMAPETMPWGQRTCYISDPEGNLIEIGSFNE